MDIADHFQIITAIQKVAHILATVSGRKHIDYDNCLLIGSEFDIPLLYVASTVCSMHQPVYNIPLKNLFPVPVFQSCVLADGIGIDLLFVIVGSNEYTGFGMYETFV